MKEKIVIFDLDQTLISSKQGKDNDYSFDCEEFGKIKTLIRPYAIECLNKINEKYDIGINTAAPRNYAYEVVNLLGIKDKIQYFYFSKHLYRPRFSGPVYKRLDHEINKYGQNNILVVDDAADYWINQKCDNSNKIEVVPFWWDFPDDDILKDLPEYVDYLFSIDFLSEYKTNYWLDDADWRKNVKKN